MFDKEKIKHQIKEIYNDKRYLTKDIYIKMYTDIYNYSTYGCVDVKAKDKAISAYKNQGTFYIFTSKMLSEIAHNYRKKIMKSNFKLEEYCSIYKHYLVCSKVVDNLYQYFNRVYISRSQESGLKNVLTYFDNALFLWNKEVVKPIFGINKRLLLDIVKTERDNIDHYLDIEKRDLLRTIINTFTEIDNTLVTYKDIFENEFLIESQKYYIGLNITDNNQRSIGDYLELYSKIVDFEQSLCIVNTRFDTFQKLREIFQRTLIIQNHNYILENFNSLIKSQDYYLMSKVYGFYVDFDIKQSMINSFNNFVENSVMDGIDVLFSNRNQDKKVFNTFVELIVEKYKYFMTVLENNFIAKIGDMIRTYHNTFNNIINNNKFEKNKNNTTIHFICQYLNQNIVKDELEDFNIIVKLLHLVKDKDVFEQYYIRYLTKRLLKHRDSYLDREHDTITKLKQIFSSEIFSKITRIINDINISIKLENDFDTKDLDSKSQLTVITYHNWNVKLDEEFHRDLSIPKSLNDITNKFNNFYSNKFSGRKLLWNHQFSHAEIHTTYLKKKYILYVSLPQYNIFERFNFNQTINSKDLSMIELEHCKYLTKNKLLVSNDDFTEFKLNYNFKNKKIKIDIHNYMPKIMANRKKDEDDRFIEEDRKLIIQSTLVRIMKTRKTLRHNELLEECVGDINRFTPKITMIKKCIEMLIDKDYFERDENNRQLYKYVA